MLLEARKINYRLRNHSILEDVHLDVRKGELMVIIGPNGAGKSTLLNILAKEIEPQETSIVFKKKDLNEWPSDILAHHKAKFSQEFNKDIGLSVKEIVLMGRYPYFSTKPSAADWKVVTKSMEATEVSHLENRLYNSLSGGEKQRVHLARVLAQLDNEVTEKLAFFDEPLNNLDVRHQYQILQTIKNFTRQGNSALVILHDLNLAAEFADRLILLQKGQVEAIGTLDEIFKKEIITRAYNFPCTICPNPVTHCPMVIFLQNRQSKQDSSHPSLCHLQEK